MRLYFFTLSYDAGVAQSIREDFWCNIKLTRWGAAPIPTAQNEYHAKDLERTWIQLGRRPLLPIRNGVKLDTLHHGTSRIHGDEKKITMTNQKMNFKLLFLNLFVFVGERCDISHLPYKVYHACTV